MPDVVLLDLRLPRRDGRPRPASTLNWPPSRPRCVATDGRHAALTVADSGPGIAEALRPRWMPPFATAAEASGDSRSAGVGLGWAGLGLAICLDIVQSLGGRLPLDKRLEQGRISGLEASARLPLARQVAVLGAVRATGQRAVVDNPWS